MHKNCPLITGGVGFALLFTGIICSWYAFPKLIDYKIGEKIALVEGNDVYNIWKKQPFPLKFKAYFFNVSNPDEVQNGENPIVREIGPYIYDEYWERVNVSINEETDTITYMLKRSFTFNQKESGCRSDTDFLTIINGALVSTALQVYLILPSAMETINDAIPYLYKGSKDVFLRASVKDILFDGILITCHDPDVEFICGAMKGMLPPTMDFTNGGKDFKFSLFAYMNKTLAGPFEIGRGLKNTTRGDIYSYKGSKAVGVWAGPQCNMINGSDSTLFYPLKAPPEKIYVFSPDICRSMFVQYEKDVVYRDIPAWRYANVPESMSWHGPNDCFCPRVKDEDYEDVPKCPKPGLADITFCVKGPILISNPHFYMGDPSLIDFVSGLNPQKELHENYMIFEPITGNPVAGRKRLQMNVELRRFEDFTLLNNISEGIMPMMWIEEGVEIPEVLRKEMHSGLTQLGMLDTFKWILIVIGVLTMICSFIMVMYRERLLCFAKMSSGKVSITEVKETRNTDVNSFNNTVLYPSLYPQVENKNVNDRVVHRNPLNTISQNTWQLKN